MTELQVAWEWFVTTLAASSPLNALLGTPAEGYVHSIYRYPAPQGSEFPKIILQTVQGASYVKINDSSTVIAPLIIQLKIQVEGTNDTLGHQINTIVRSLVEKHQTRVEYSGHLINSNAVDPIDLPVEENGKVYQQIGDRYRVSVRPQVV